jgi:hypothetical protein
MRWGLHSISCKRTLVLLTFLASSMVVAQQPNTEPHHEPLTENLSQGASFTFQIAPDLPQFTFKVIPEVQEPDGDGNPQSTIHDVQVFRGSSSEPLQSLSGCEWLGMEAPYRSADWFRVEDMNFDGYADLFVLTSWGATGNESGCVWLFNPKAGRFEFSKEFSELGAATFDATSKTISIRGHAGASTIAAARYVVENNRPVLVLTVNQDFDPVKQQYHCVVRQRRASKTDLVATRDFWAKTLEDACDPTDPFGEVGRK